VPLKQQQQTTGRNIVPLKQQQQSTGRHVVPLKQQQQSTGRHIVPLGYIILIPSKPITSSHYFTNAVFRELHGFFLNVSFNGLTITGN
jgi:hypothetical protein